MRAIPLALCVGLAACTSETPIGGTAVGNPTKGLTMQVAPASDVTSLAASLHVARLELVACDGTLRTLASGLTVDAVGGSRFELPEGLWCGVQVDANGELGLSGTTDSGGTFDVSLDLTRVRVRGATPFDTGAVDYVLRLGPDAWLNQQGLGLDQGGDVRIDRSDPRHEDAVRWIEERSVLFADEDGDGVLSTAEVVVAYGKGLTDSPEYEELRGDGDSDDDDDTGEHEEPHP